MRFGVGMLSEDLSKAEGEVLDQSRKDSVRQSDVSAKKEAYSE